MSGATQDFFESFKMHARDLAKDKEIPAFALSITNVENHAICFMGADQNTVFPIASLSKSFAAALTAMLVQDGLLDWDDPVVKFDVGFKLSEPAATEALTIRHVLSQINPLPPHALDHLTDLGFPFNYLLDKLAIVPLDGDFKHSYQNVLFNVIQLIIEKVSKLSYQQCLTQRILHPLGMTSVCLTQDEYDRYEQKLKPHMLKDGKIVELPGTNKIFTLPAATGMCLSIADLNKWLVFCLQNYEGVLKPIFRPPDRADPPYAMGWWQADEMGSVNCHDGSAVGYLAHMAIVPTRQYAIAILTNVSGVYFGKKIVELFLRVVTRQPDLNIFKNFNYRDLDQPRIPLDLVKGQYSCEFLGNVSLQLEEKDGSKTLIFTVCATGATGSLKPHAFTCYSNDTRPKILDLRKHATFKITWQGDMTPQGKLWYQEDLITAVQEAPDKPAQSLLFLFAGMHSNTFEAKRVIPSPSSASAPQQALMPAPKMAKV